MKTSINPDLLDKLYGTWTFVSQSEADFGYYKAKAYLVVHFMPDPSQTLGCSKDKCDEFQNQLCQDEGSTCVDTETNLVQWSDVAALYQFGFQVDSGFAIKSHIRQSTGDWLGPYNVILAEAPSPKQGEVAEARRNLEVGDSSTSLYVSRLVQTASSQYVKPPSQCNIVAGDNFDEYVGLAAIQSSIKTQKSYPLDLSKDPYSDHLGTCDNGNLEPVLPRFTIKAPKQFSNLNNNATSAPPPSLELSLRYPILSLPFKGNQLTKWWPTLQKRLTKPSIVAGPYCYNFALQAYTVDLNFAKQGQDPAWQFVKGCVDGLPCYHDTPTGNGGGNHPGIPDATSSAILKWVDQYLGATGLIAVSVLLVISLICNMRLCCKVRAKRRQLREQSRTRRDEETGAGVRSSMTRQRRQVRTMAARSTNRQPSQQSQSMPQTQPQPRSAQILTPSRLVRKQAPSDSEQNTPLLPKKDPSAQSQPSMDRTPAAQNAPLCGKMNPTADVTKPATEKDPSSKEPPAAKTIFLEETATADGKE